MNRVIMVGIAVFLALIAISLFGSGADWAVAGHGCCGCHGSFGCNGGGCHGGGYGCHGGHSYGCHGGGYDSYDGGNMQGAPTEAAPPPPASANRAFQRQPSSFRRIAFRR
jgi:hypothetical protein